MIGLIFVLPAMRSVPRKQSTEAFLGITVGQVATVSTEEQSPRQQSETEAAVLTAITGQEPRTPEGDTSCHRTKATQPRTIIVPQIRSGSPLTSPAACHPRTCGAPRVEKYEDKCSYI
ncbi:hypothetical protein AVEN_177055-1 [Araneus ventricosus]|uniref:Uncharacterized protein n=1 Tax=Araneus ventricosus TaxID=182803 RepID=A0A4Y2CTG9_ARAVE|nr:hypothetical protein AVEN_177055-1 [Araneus ventricosus]